MLPPSLFGDVSFFVLVFSNDGENCNKDLLEDLIQCLSRFPLFVGPNVVHQSWVGRFAPDHRSSGDRFLARLAFIREELMQT